MVADMGARGADGTLCEVVAAEGPGRPKHQADDGLMIRASTAYNVAIIAVWAYAIHIVLEDVKKDGSVSVLHWTALARSFSPDTLAYLFGLWLLLNGALVLANVGFRCWRSGHDCIRKPFMWDSVWTLAALLLHVAMLVLPVTAAYWLDLPASAVCALCFEQTRLLMKSYAYLREHVRGALAVPRRDTNVTLGHLAYYMFAPTLLYSDSYERAPHVRLRALLHHAVVFLVTLATMVVAAGRGALRPFCEQDASLLELWADLGLPRYVYQLTLVSLRAVPAGAVLAVGAALALHHWHRMFAEALRFRQRRFTRAWWNATCYVKFFHDWNQIVKAWLHKYIYKEMRALGVSPNKCKFVTVIVSAAWHEYLFAASLGYLVPYFFGLYMFGAACGILDPCGLQKKAFGNFFVLITLSGGISSSLSFYFMESTARRYCPQIEESPVDFFLPRALMCEYPFKNCSFI